MAVDIPFSNGVEFPANPVRPTDLCNTIWDYKERPWTATLSGTGGSTAHTYVSRLGRYTKVGERVFFEVRIVLSAKGVITGSVRIEGLPFVASIQAPVTFGFWLLATAKVSVYAMIGAGESNINLAGLPVAGVGPINLVDADIAANTELYLSGNYRVFA